ncbi:MAG: hypothetical protein ACTSUT_19630 [Promethearchaeota archaeon]
MEENDKPLTPEEIEKQKKIVDALYKKKKEETAEYLKSVETDRIKSFEESKEQISENIEKKAFIMGQKKEKDAALKGLREHVDIEKTGDAISGSIGEKAFIIEKKKEKDEALKGLREHIDIEKIGDIISESIEKKATLIAQEKEKEKEQEKEKPSSVIGEKIFGKRKSDN